MRNDFDLENEPNQPTLRLAVSRRTAPILPTSPTQVPESLLPEVPGYELLSILGAGGMGVVYKARQHQPDRIVALKMIRPEVADDPDLQSRFLAEAEAAARLNHPGIVQVYAIGDHQGRPYLALEFIEGTTLEGQINGKPSDPIVAANLVLQLADAIDHAHRNGIIHRDMKPANVLIDDQGRPHITDFGIARFLEGDSRVVTRNGEILGTPAYMAPEQAGTGTIGARTDVYALGVILYELLTGRPPFVAPTGLETIQLVLHAEPVPPRKLQPNLPRDLETIVLKCLSRDPRGRYDDARSLAGDLHRWLSGRPILARPVSRLTRLARWCFRNPVTTALTAALTLALATLVVLGAVWVRDAENQRVEDAHRTERERTERAHLEQELQDDLDAIEKYLREEDWPNARAALQHAEGILQHHDITEYRQRIAAMQQLLDLVAALDRIVAGLGRARGDSFDLTGRDAEYQGCLEPLGIAPMRAIEPEWIDPLKRSPIRKEFIRSLDGWASIHSRLGQFDSSRWLLRVANAIDEDDWQVRARQAVIDARLDVLVEMSREPETVQRSRDQARLLGSLLHLSRKREEAVLWYRRAQTAHPNDFSINNALGWFLLEESTPESLQEARGCFRAALAIRPESAGVQLNLGVVLWKLKRYPESLVAYIRAAELQPDYTTAYHNQAVIYQLLDRPDEAIAAFERAIKLEPNSPPRYYRIATLHLRQGRVAELRQSVRKIIENGQYRFELAQNLMGEIDSRGLREVELEIRGLFLRADPMQPGLLYDQGLTLKQVRRFPEAMQHLLQAQRLLPEQPANCFQIGWTYQELGRFDEGLEWICRGHELAQRSPRNQPSEGWLVEAGRLATIAGWMKSRSDEAILAQLAPAERPSALRVAVIQHREGLATQIQRLMTESR